MAKTAEQAVANYLAGMANAGQKYTQGVQNFQGNPMALAAGADAQQRYLQNTAAAVNSGRMAAKLNAVPKQAWVDGAVQKGAQRLSTGAQLAKPKVMAHFNSWMPTYLQASAAVRNMPKGGRANALARVSAVLDLYAAKSGKNI